MKPSFQHLGFDAIDASFLCYVVNSPKFGFHWHYHPECEISYVVKGYGTRLVGDHVEEFAAGDLLFLGPDVPHTLISDELFNQSGQNMEVVVVQFRKEIIEARSLEIVELNGISQLIQDSFRGLHFGGAAAGHIGQKLCQLPEKEGFWQYHGLLEVLHELSTEAYRPLASAFYSPNLKGQSEARLSKVCNYIHDHFCENIEIASLAGLACMNEAAFCRFFKKMTGKTAINYINDLRIGKACQLLLADTMTISEAAYESGYNSITHFNRNFFKRKKVNPSEYRKHYLSRN